VITALTILGIVLALVLLHLRGRRKAHEARRATTEAAHRVTMASVRIRRARGLPPTTKPPGTLPALQEEP
jgi:hypothetical protein